MKKRSNLNVMARLIGLVRPLLGYMILAILLGLLGHLMASFITIFAGYTILSFWGLDAPTASIPGFTFARPWIFYALCMGVFAIVRGFARYIEQSCNHYIAFKLLALIRSKVFAALRKLCPAKLEGRDRGDLISVITSDIELLEVFYAHTISPIAIATIYSAIMSIFIGRYHVSLGLLALAAYLTVGVIVPLVASKRSGCLGQEFRDTSGQLSAHVLDSLRGLSETIQYDQGDVRLREMNDKTDAMLSSQEKMKRVAGRDMAATNTLILIFDVLMLVVSASLYVNGVMDCDGILIAPLAMMSSFGPVVALASLGTTLQNTFASGNRVLDILDEEPQIAEVSGEPKTEFGPVTVEDISFSYEEEKVLNHLSLDIPPTGIYGICGKSGSGKSTLLKLLMRFWDTEEGRLAIGGREVRSINTADLRAMEGFMTQQTHLFSDTIAENVRIARLDATREEIEEACKKASIHDFILSLPQGYDTPVGELGDSLSGGEKQRIGLARAFLHDAPLLLLDEPTSNLDSLNEGVILRSLIQEKENHLVLLVSHRASTMRAADAMCTVENGRVS